MKKTYLSALVAGACLSASVSAAPRVPLEHLPMYWGVSYSWTNFTASNATEDAEMGAITGRLGYEVFPWLSAEGRFTKGVRDDDVTLTGGTGSLQLDQAYGLYGKFSLPTDINLTPYALLGYGQAEVSLNLPSGETVNADDSGLSYGIGVDLCKDHPVCLNLEYMQFLDEDAVDLSGFNVGLKIKF